MDDREDVTKGESPKAKPLTRLEDMDVSFVSLVPAGANRQKSFLIIKALTCPACGATIVPNDGRCPECGAEVEVEVEGAQKAAEVPEATASNEDKQAALEARARKYGVEALSVGAALSYPAGAPTTPDLYADPVNLKYPFGSAGNTRDPGRLRNAAARFAQNVGTYSQRKSKSTIWGRIVSAELDAGIEHAPNDLDELLPSDVKRRLASSREEKMGKQSATPSSPIDLAAFLAKLGDADQTCAQAMAEIAFAKGAAAGVDLPAPPPPSSPPVVAPEPAPPREETTKAAERDPLAKALAERERELSAMRTDLEKARLAQVASEARARALLATIGASSAMPSGEVVKAVGERNKPQPRKLWAPDMNTLRREQETPNGRKQ